MPDYAYYGKWRIFFLLFSSCFLGQNLATIINVGALGLFPFQITLYFQLQEITAYEYYRILLSLIN